MAKTSLVYPLDIERDSCYYISEAEDEPTSPTSDQPLDYGKELIDMNVTIETKVCTKCGEDKPLSEYGKRKKSKDGLRLDCKACVSAYNRSYRESNLEQVRALDREYYKSHRDRLIEYQRDYAQKFPEKVKAYQKAYKADRYANDPEFRSRHNAYNTRRSRLLAEAVQEPYLREAIFERDNWTCGICEEPIDPELRFPDSDSASIDHVIPLSLGGDDTPANVQAAHFGCNSSKRNRVELEDLQAA